MKFLTILTAATLLTACQTTGYDYSGGGLPANVENALPIDISGSQVQRNAAGCYSYTVEGLTFPVVDLNQYQICD